MYLNGLEKYFNNVEGVIDCNQFNEDGYNPLLFVFFNNSMKNLNLNHKQLDYLIKKTDLMQSDKIDDTEGWSVLMCATRMNYPN